jgi:hypothetical protein
MLVGIQCVTYLCLPSNACSTFMASFALVSKYGIPPLDWQKAMARFDEIYAKSVKSLLCPPSSVDVPLSCSLPRQSCFRSQPVAISMCPTRHSQTGVFVRKEKSLGPWGLLVLRTRPSSCPESRNSWSCSHRRPAHSNQRRGKKQRLVTGSVPAPLYPISVQVLSIIPTVHVFEGRLPA